MVRSGTAGPARRAALARCALLAMLAFFVMCGSRSVQAIETEHISKAIPSARLAGQDSFRWFGLKIYSAQLWVGEAGFRSEAPTAAPFALELRYARSLVGTKIADSSIDEIEKLGLGTLRQQRAWLRQMREIFPDVEEGTRLTGIYLPAAGVHFFLNGKFLAEVPDADFGRAFFAIWLDPKTSAPKLRDALLWNAAPSAAQSAAPTAAPTAAPAAARSAAPVATTVATSSASSVPVAATRLP